MLVRRPSHYPAVTLAIFAALAVTLAFTGCSSGVHMTYLHTGLDSADTGEAPPVDTGEIGAAYADVIGLPACSGAWVRLPPGPDGHNGERDVYSVADLHELVYGDGEAGEGLPVVVGVGYLTDAQAWAKVSDGLPLDGAWLEVSYAIGGAVPQDEQVYALNGYALACPR